MDQTNKLQQSIKELRRLTGLPLALSLTEDMDLEKAQQQMNTLCSVYKEATNKEVIMRKWLLGEISEDDFYLHSSRLHLHSVNSRCLFLIQFQREIPDDVTTVLKNMFSDSESMLFSIHSNQLAMIRHIPAKLKSAPKEMAYEILNILQTELMVRAVVSFGNITENLSQMPAAYQEANLTLQIGTLFYPDRTVYGCHDLGVGSLLYGLPEETCRNYIRSNLGEYFLDNESSIFESDVLETADCFLHNNLNIAETSRQLHIHRNTLLYRLEQIQNETGLDIRKFNAAMTYKLSSMILHYLRYK